MNSKLTDYHEVITTELKKSDLGKNIALATLQKWEWLK